MRLEDQIAEVIAEAIGVEKTLITPETKSVDVAGWDSMGQMTILFAITAKYGVEIAPDEVDKLNSVHGITELIRACGRQP